MQVFRTRLIALVLVALLMVLVTSGCRQSAQPTPTPSADVQITIVSDPNPPAAGAATLIVAITDAQGSPLTASLVKVRGDMNHAGMIPEFGESTQATDGVYRVPFNWSMGGDWILTVDVTLSDGRTIRREFDFSVQS